MNNIYHSSLKTFEKSRKNFQTAEWKQLCNKLILRKKQQKKIEDVMKSSLYSIEEKNTEQKFSRRQRVVRILKNINHFLQVTYMAISAIFQHIVELYTSGCKELAETIFFSKRKAKCSGLVAADYPVPKSQQKYEINKAIMSNISSRTTDVNMKYQAEFLTENYLGKVAPVQMDILEWLIPDVQSVHQVSPHMQYHYHRYAFIDQPDIGQTINKKKFALAESSPLIPTDNIEFTELYPLAFEQVDNNLELSFRKLTEHFNVNSKNPFSKPLDKPFLFDLTNAFENIMTKENEIKAKAKLKEIKKLVSHKLEVTVRLLAAKYPKYFKWQIKNWLEKSCVFLCRVKDKESSVCGIKVLSIFQDVSGAKYLNAYPSLVEFISNTGIFIGSVSLRRNIWPHIINKGRSDFITKSTQPTDKINIYFDDPKKITESPFMYRLIDAFDNSELPQFRVMGMGALALIKGLMNEISPEKWKKLQSEDFNQEVIQVSLYKIMTELASALHQYQLRNFSAFSQQIEVVHAEIANLLEIMRPFDESQYSDTYKRAIGTIPGINPEYIKPALCRTGVNAFAGINAAILETHNKPVRAYGKGFYFEQAGFIGYDNTLEALLDDETFDTIDLYSCQFNPNIEIASKFTHYEGENVEANINSIFEKKPKTQRLTVAVDCTIDYIRSESMKKLLSTFQSEIEKGKINFIFFRSGQKLDQFGMDTYYGAPIVQVNNGESHWKPFERLLTGEAYRTDPLSVQWFCLAFKYATSFLEEYRELIFTNSHNIVDAVPKKLKAGDDQKSKTVRVSTFSKDMLPSFIDIKVSGPQHSFLSKWILARFYQKFYEKGIKIDSRASFGFYHPNIIIIQINEVSDSSTIRLNPGVDPSDIALINQLIQELAL